MMPQEARFVWAVRLLLATLFFFGADVLLWRGLLQLAPADLLVRVLGYGALAVLTLDFAQRYRIEDVYDAMILLAMVGLLVGLLIDPRFAYADALTTLMTRGLGGFTLLLAEMFAVLLALLHLKRRYRWRLLAFSAWVGFYWGVWMRWQPELRGLFPAVDVRTMLLVLIGFLLLIALLYGRVRRYGRGLQTADFRLPRRGWWLLLALVAGLLLWQVVNGALDLLAAVVTLLLVVGGRAVLWYRSDESEHPFLQTHIPLVPPGLPVLLAAVTLFVVMALFAYSLPLVALGNYHQLWLMEIGFAVVGALWVPLAGVTIAVRAVDLLMRSSQID